MINIIGGAGGGGADGVGLTQNPVDTNWKMYFEEFLTSQVTYIAGDMGTIAYSGGTGASTGALSVTSGNSGRIGLYKMVSGSSAASYAGAGTYLDAFYTGGGTLRMGAAVQLVNVPDATNDFNSAFGLCDGVSTLGANSVGLLIDRSINTTNWLAISQSEAISISRS